MSLDSPCRLIVGPKSTHPLGPTPEGLRRRHIPSHAGPNLGTPWSLADFGPNRAEFGHVWSCPGPLWSNLHCAILLGSFQAFGFARVCAPLGRFRSNSAPNRSAPRTVSIPGQLGRFGSALGTFGPARNGVQLQGFGRTAVWCDEMKLAMARRGLVSLILIVSQEGSVIGASPTYLGSLNM